MSLSTQIIEPKTDLELKSYFNLRWEVLRKPWGQPIGSEKDSTDATAFHRMVIDSDNTALGVGMLILNSKDCAQIRFMGVLHNNQKNKIGTKLISSLESVAIRNSNKLIILHARENAIGFYVKNGYQIIEKSYLLYNEIQHFLMQKSIH